MSKDKAPRDEIKIEHKKIMCPDCSHVFTFSSMYKSDDYLELEAKLAECVKWIENETDCQRLSFRHVRPCSRCETLARVKK